jgi:hypothetical protein
VLELRHVDEYDERVLPDVQSRVLGPRVDQFAGSGTDAQRSEERLVVRVASLAR